VDPKLFPLHPHTAIPGGLGHGSFFYALGVLDPAQGTHLYLLGVYRQGFPNFPE